MLKSVTIDKAAKTATIVLDLLPPTPSSTGKTTIIAKTGGNVTSAATFEGKPVVVGATLYIK